MSPTGKTGDPNFCCRPDWKLIDAVIVTVVLELEPTYGQGHRWP
jgi:hypothetical protein